MESNRMNRSKLIDTIARYVISIVGIGTIFSIGAILVVIFMEFLPLFRQNRAETRDLKVVVQNADGIVYCGLDPYFEKMYSIDPHGQAKIQAIDGSGGIETLSLNPFGPEVTIITINKDLRDYLTILWSNNRISRCKLLFQTHFNENGHRTLAVSALKTEPLVLAQGVYIMALSRESDSGGRLYVALDKAGDLHATAISTTENFLGEKTESSQSMDLKTSAPVTMLAASVDGRYLFALTNEAEIYRWDLRDPASPVLLEKYRPGDNTRYPVCMAAMIGGLELAVGFSDGSIDIYNPLAISNEPDSKKILRSIHHLKAGSEAIHMIVPSPRTRSLVAVGQSGKGAMFHTTNEHKLLELGLDSPITQLDISERGKGICAILKNGRIALLEIHAEHPEFNTKAMFGSIHYAGYEKPGYFWQSSSGNDDFEPKLSLMPLVFGTLKGALYALILSIPISVLAALYTSQFAGSKLRGIVKPVVEIMAAVPSVVIGFLAALWLAPILDNKLLFMMLCFLVMPILILVFMFLPMRTAQREKRHGAELFVMVPLLITTFTLLYYFSAHLEMWAFDNDFKTWFVALLGGGKHYDMNNSIVISTALGFAVIPIIFTMSEDAFSNVPRSLTTASLALGASPWQTAWRVVLPAASPGIFAGIILGLGRAIGETMIVLMATGNTPIMDPSIFNGMRTLSANIAVEIAEAPVGGTLYRVLFLSAGILLIFTSILNTITEMIRHRLRKTYSKF